VRTVSLEGDDWGAGAVGVIGPETASFLAGGVAIMVASRDAELQPEISRGWGPEVRDEGGAVRICLIAPPPSPARANLAGNRAIAMNCTMPSSYRAVQIKGTVLEVGDPTAEDLERAREHAARFVGETVKVGAPAPSEHYIAAIDLAVTLAASEVYDQTPGPKAGARV
jgi:hypothetical protein